MLHTAVAEDGVVVDDPGERLQEGGAADQRQPLGVVRAGFADADGQGCSR
jgi:hypothetical protein